MLKPPGQFSIGTWAPAQEMTLETAVRRYLNPADPGAAYLGIVHRLDRPTSGLLIWAKTPKAARRLSAQFEKRKVFKEYWAIVESGGLLPPTDIPEFEWTDWLTRADSGGIVRSVEPGSPGAREGVTSGRIESADGIPPGLSWLRLWPKTGRTHQLRVQSSRRGWPILGDQVYGAKTPAPCLRGIALHARAISLNHPSTGAPLTLIAPVPPTWAEAGIRMPERTRQGKS